MNKYFIYILTAVVIGISGNAAIATPITNNSLIHILQFDNADPTLAFSSTSTSSSFSNTYSSAGDIQALGNLTTGKVGTSVIEPDIHSESIVSIFDTLTFDTGSVAPVEVFFDLNYEGTLASRGSFNAASATNTVWIYDITGLDTWLETMSVFGIFDTTCVIDAAEFITFERLEFALSGIGVNEVLQNFNSTKTGSFMADPFKTYGIQIGSHSTASRNSRSDFLGTGTFQFTNLNGATFSSSSGVFLSQQVATAPVPEPSTMLLLGLGLVGLIWFKTIADVNRLHKVKPAEF